MPRSGWRTRVPPLAEMLFKMVTPAKERCFVLGDLREEFHRMMMAGSSRRAARRWYWRQLFGSVLPGLRRIMGPRPPGLQPSNGGLVRNFGHDLRLAGRGLARRPLFTAVAATTLAVGIGATVAMFSIVNGVLLTRLGYTQPDRVVHLFSLLVQAEGQLPMSYPDFHDLRERTRTLSEAAAMMGWGATLFDGEPLRVTGASVSGNYFDVLGVQPAVGRFFLPEEGELGHEPVVVLSHSFWQRRFGGDPGLVGQALELSGISYTVVGVAPHDLEVPWGEVDMWRARPDYFSVTRASRGSHNTWPIARIASGATLDEVNAELAEIAVQLEPEEPAHRGQRFQAVPIMDVMVGSVRPVLIVLLGSVALVLLIACANVANLLLSRATERKREIAVRSSLGAARGQIIAQLLSESVLLAALGGVLGVGIAYVSVDLFVALGTTQIPRASLVHIDRTVLAFALGVSMLTAIVFGLAPAVQASKVDLAQSLREGGRGSTDGAKRRAARHGLVVAEVALCSMLLIGAGLFLKSLNNLTQVETGYSSEDVLTFRLSPIGEQYQEHDDLTRYYQDVIARLSAIPGVTSVGAASFSPLGAGENQEDVTRDDRPLPDPVEIMNAPVRAVTPDYLPTLGISLLRGRQFSDADDVSAPDVAIVSEDLVRQLFPGEDPIGRYVTVDYDRSRRIVGVVEDVRHRGVQEDVRPTIYAPHAQQFIPYVRRAMSVGLKTQIDHRVLADAVRTAVWDVDPTVPVQDYQALAQLVFEDMGGPRFRATLLTTFATLALLLAMIGVAGAVAYSVAQRRSEIGIRMALGARSGTVVGMVMKEGMRQVVLGMALGVGGALALGSVVESMLFDVAPRDPVALVASSMVLTTVAALAIWIPAARAAGVGAFKVLREE